MSKALNDLHVAFRPLAFELLARAVESRLQVVIIDTLRTAAEQAEYVRVGASKRPDSLHLHGLAIDVGLAPLLKLKNWAPQHEDWAKLGAIGEGLGLRWGGRWKSFPDCPHFECSAEMERAVLGKKGRA